MWFFGRPRVSNGKNRNSHRYHHHHHHRESPTALHAVLGVALFLFGNVIAQNPSLALSREPTTPAPYWLAALDVFDAGENLPCQTSGGNDNNNADGGADNDDKGNDNWRVAIVWGRTLVSLAYDATKQQHPRSSPSPSPSPSSATARPPRYSPRSPLAAITALRTAGLAHHGRAAASAPELLTLAADQFSRGIFHMPHTTTTTRTHDISTTRCCHRAHVLFTLASDVLAVAERLDDAVELRRRWAAWADAVFQQMHMEGVDVADEAWRVRVAVARGRCWLVVGGGRVEELEDALERGERRVLMSKEAEDARAGLNMGEQALLLFFFFFSQRHGGFLTRHVLFCLFYSYIVL